jgi:hypothetical protein
VFVFLLGSRQSNGFEPVCSERKKLAAQSSVAPSASVASESSSASSNTVTPKKSLSPSKRVYFYLCLAASFLILADVASSFFPFFCSADDSDVMNDAWVYRQGTTSDITTTTTSSRK